MNPKMHIPIQSPSPPQLLSRILGFNPHALALMVVFLSPVFGCSGSEDSPSDNSSKGAGIAAGNYIGEITIEGSKPFVSGNSKFTVDSAGNIVGTVKTDDKSDIPGDVGNITGTSKFAGTGLLEIQLSYESTKMGKYVAKGSEPYSPMIKKIAFSPSARNTMNEIVGRFFFLGEPE